VEGKNVEEAYHPDARFYDYGGGDGDSKTNDSVEDAGIEERHSCPPLKFRCYEAHIPYTMQVFKDLNLSGMSYVKIRSGMFRQSLPKKERVRTVRSSFLHGDDLFLENNVSDQSKWDAVATSESRISLQVEAYPTGTPLGTASSSPLPTKNSERTPQQYRHGGFLSQSSSSAVDVMHPTSCPSESKSASRLPHSCPSDIPIEDQYWTTKETLCDVEIDSTVDELLNVKDVMTSLPDDPTERARVHWRAVPSLREIWELERSRMASLVSKGEDFLNSASDDQSTPPLTLTAKAGGSVPGAELALKGAKKLYNPSPGLEDDYRRALGDIVQRHDDFMKRVDNAFEGGSAVFSPPSGRQEFASPSPSQDEALAALGTLGGQFCDRNVEQTYIQSQERGRSPRLSLLSLETSDSHGSRSRPIRSSPLSQIAPLTQMAPLTQAQMEHIHKEAAEFGQSVEREEVVLQAGTSGSPSDPFTFTPHDDDEEEDGGAGDVFEEEERLGEEGFARSLSVLATQHAMSNDSGEHEGGDGMGSHNAQHGFAALASRGMKHPNSHFNETDRAIETIHEDEHNCSSDDASEYDDNNGREGGRIYQDSQDRTEPSNRNTAADESQECSEMSGLGISCLPISDNVNQLFASQCTSLVRGEFVVPRGYSAPRRRRYECSAKKAHILHRAHIVKNDQSQPWLRLSGRCEAQTICGSAVSCSNRFRNAFVQPVNRPPSARQVAIWTTKCRRRGDGMNDASQRRKQKRKGTELEIDGNSRKLIAVAHGVRKKKRVAFANDVVQSSCQVFAIEEVDWEGESVNRSKLSQSPSQSQSSLLSLSQEDRSPRVSDQGRDQSQPDEDVEKRPLSYREKESVSGVDASTTKAQAYSAFDPSCTMGVGAGQSSSPADDALAGIGQQGGRLQVAGGGGLKGGVDAENEAAASSTNHLSSAPTPVAIFSIEVHVQCRTGKAGANDSRTIAMRPDPTRDKIAACVYLYARDPGGGEPIDILERGILFTPVEAEGVGQGRDQEGLIVRKSLGISLDRAKMEMVGNERQLLLRLASIVKWKDPDALMSWDTQGGGLGYLIERGVALGKEPSSEHGGENGGASAKLKAIDMVKLLGRIIKKREKSPSTDDSSENTEWSGSGLGSEWDDRVGAGAAASSIEGRLVICGWKMIAEEVKHPNSSYLPAMVSTILGKRIPHHDDLILTRWYSAESGRYRRRVLEHRLAQAAATLMLFDALDIIGRAGEAARLSGVEFSQSLPGIRGSQYKVEGCLLRALQSVWSDERGEKRGKNNIKATFTGATQANVSKDSASLSNESSSQVESPWKLQRGVARKADGSRSASQPTEDSSAVDAGDRGYFFFSPSKEDCGNQEALECQAMTLEPQSGFHFDPIVVCDFTALYPSLIIAYNLCYSSCAGKLDYHSTRKEMRREGQTTGRLGPFHYDERRTATVLKHHMKSLSSANNINADKKDRDRAYVIPTGSLFVSETVVKGVLPQVLDEILATRAMLKRAAKTYKKHVPNVAASILRSLEAKQLALKYVANVTYGYTSATFSGRSAMPLLADAIVECGRRTLTNAIELANQWGQNEDGRWHGAHVVYGDTDSVFVKLPGRSVEEAFAFGETFCKAVTASNPPPVQLKLEKVYVASLLQTKKKYCGMKYESPNDARPVFEAKGIETVRRDQCSLTQKVLRNALITMFQSGLEPTKAYLQRQWALIHAGRLPISDYILTGRVRSHYRGGKVGPVQAALARRLAEADPGRTVRHKERIPYVIVAAPGLNFRLRDCVLTPTECLEQWDAYTIHAAYYIKKHVNAALQRCFGLPPFRLDVNAWYETSPKPRKRIHHWPITRTGASAMITAHFGSDSCALCGDKCKAKGSARAVVCAKCSRDKVAAAFLGMERLNNAEQEADRVASICRECNGCPESSSTFAIERMVTGASSRLRSGAGNGDLGTVVRRSSSKASGVVTPLANCECIDCPVTYERHRLREAQIEAEAVCRALEII